MPHNRKEEGDRRAACCPTPTDDVGGDPFERFVFCSVSLPRLPPLTFIWKSCVLNFLASCEKLRISFRPNRNWFKIKVFSSLLLAILSTILFQHALLARSVPRAHAIRSIPTSLRFPSFLLSTSPSRLFSSKSSSSVGSMSEKQKRINLAGWKQCGAFLQAKTALSGLQVIFPQKYAVNITECTLLPDARHVYLHWRR